MLGGPSWPMAQPDKVEARISAIENLRRLGMVKGSFLWPGGTNGLSRSDGVMLDPFLSRMRNVYPVHPLWQQYAA